MGSPFDSSGCNTPEGPSMNALGLTFDVLNDAPAASSNLLRPEDLGQPMDNTGGAPLSYSWEGMAAFPSRFDPADFNLSGFTFDEPGGFEASAEIKYQCENNTTPARVSQWNLNFS